MEAPDPISRSIEAESLIEAAMSDVRVVVCELCKGLGKHPEGLGVRCPRCHGKGEHVTTGEAQR